jgi:hypothetical protein
MGLAALLLLLSGAYPLLRAWPHVRRTSLAHAFAWAALAWLAWTVLLALVPVSSSEALAAGRYAGLSLIACAGMAVLGARRPGVGAWNFVVLGLLAVLLLSWVEGLLTGTDVELSGLRAVFLAGLLGLLILNYLPTRLGLSALLLAIGCVLEFTALLSGPAKGSPALLLGPAWAGLFLGTVPWAGWAALRWQPTAASDVDRLWHAFRDSYGLVWAQRVREQFNRSAANAGWAIELGWRGLRPIGAAPPPDAAAQAAARATLEALLKRFGLLSDGGEQPH